MQLDVRLSFGASYNTDSNETVVAPEHSAVSIPVTGSENESFGDLCVGCFVSHKFPALKRCYFAGLSRACWGWRFNGILRMEELA